MKSEGLGGILKTLLRGFIGLAKFTVLVVFRTLQFLIWTVRQIFALTVAIFSRKKTRKNKATENAEVSENPQSTPASVPISISVSVTHDAEQTPVVQKVVAEKVVAEKVKVVATANETKTPEAFKPMIMTSGRRG